MHHLEWYADTVPELREWERLLRSLMIADDAERKQHVHTGWFVVLPMGPAMPSATKQWLKVEEGARLSCYDVENNESVEAARLTMSLTAVERVRLLDHAVAQALLRGGERAGAEGGVSETTRKEVNVRLRQPGQPLGLEFFETGGDEAGGDGLYIAGAEEGSAVAEAFADGTLQPDDRLVALDGNLLANEDEYDQVLDALEHTRRMAHTLLVERTCEVMVPLQGRALDVATKGQRWILYPCNGSSLDKPMPPQAATSILHDWHEYIGRLAQGAADKRTELAAGREPSLLPPIPTGRCVYIYIYIYSLTPP